MAVSGWMRHLKSMEYRVWSIGGVLPWGRDVITIMSVGGRTSERSVTLLGSSHVPLRTAAMAMAALPETGISG